jgi:hypothetical protein
MADESAPDPVEPEQSPASVAMAALADMVRGYVEAATGTRTQLIESGFPPDVASQMAADLAVEMFRAAMRVGSGPRARKKSWFDQFLDHGHE